jgi:glycosyltransferase involved in cell wall biosynthesis
MQKSIKGAEKLRVLDVKQAVLGSDFWAECEFQTMIALAKRGYNVRMILPSMPNARKPASYVAKGFVLDAVVIRKRKSILALAQFLFVALFKVAVLAGEIDCLIMEPQTALFVFPIVLLRRLITRLPVLVLRVESNPVETGGWIRTMFWTVRQEVSIRIAGIFFDKIYFISPMLRDYYCSGSRLPKSKLGIWPSSVDLQVFDPMISSERKIMMLKKRLNIKNQFVIIYHGGISRARGLMEAVRAMELLKDEHSNTILILLGYGDFREEIKRYIQSKGLGDVVIVPDPVQSSQEVAEYLAASDFEILPMPDHIWWRYQCFLKVLECLAMNKPLVSTNLPAVRAIVDGAPVVFWLEGSSARDIADGIRSYIAKRHTLKPQLGRGIASQFTRERNAQMLEAEIAQTYNVRRSTSINES